MAHEHRGGKKKERKMEGLCWLYWLEPSMSEGSISHAEDWSANRCHLWAPKDEHSGHFLGLSSDCPGCDDQEKTAFISHDANYYYTVMPFELKNTGATYQQMMTRMFRDKIRCTFEVYIDDKVVKSKWEMQHIYDLKRVFEVLRWHKLHLNADKCAFEVGLASF